MSIVDLLLKIPAVVWSGIVASAITLSGVLLINWSNTNRLKLQLGHDAAEKAKQRKADIRKEVYLLAAEQIVKANMHLATLPQLNLSETNASDGLQGFFAAAAKLQIIAETKTALMVSELVGFYAELLFKMLAKARPIHDLETSARIAGEHYDRASSEISRILSSMAQYNESAKLDEPAFIALNHSFEAQQKLADKYSKERNDFLSRKNSLHLAFTQELLLEMKKVSKESMLTMIEIRKELEVSSDINEFMRQLERQHQKITTQMNAFLEKLARP